MFGTKKTLIVVYKDEMLMNQLKKLVETRDDIDNENPIGTKDGSVNIISWSEKVWLDNKKAGNITGKVLFIGDIKGTDKLIPVIDVKFDEFGVKFGWAGNQAVVSAVPKAVSSRENYLEFIQTLSVFPVPEIIKNPKNVKVAAPTAVKGPTEENVSLTTKDNDKKVKALLGKAKGSLIKSADAVGKVSMNAAVKAEDLLRDKNAVARQQLFFGVVNLYNNGLEEFMNA